MSQQCFTVATHIQHCTGDPWQCYVEKNEKRYKNQKERSNIFVDDMIMCEENSRKSISKSLDLISEFIKANIKTKYYFHILVTNN